MSKELLYNVPTKQSSGNAWIQWHKTLKSSLGEKNANLLFIQAFEKRGSTGVVTEDMQNYFEKQGIQLDQTWINNAKGVISDSFDIASDIFTAGAYFSAIMVGAIG